MNHKKIAKQDSISVIIPAFNEQDNIKQTVLLILRVLRDLKLTDYEILIINDGSTDNTAYVVRQLSEKYPQIRVIHFYTNQGIGSAFRKGIMTASKAYITGCPADMDWSINSFRNLLRARKDDRLISCYVDNMNDRQVGRRIFSNIFTTLMNFMFKLKLKYYNGYFICPSTYIQSTRLTSSGFTIFAEIKVKLIRKGIKFIEISSKHEPRLHGISKAYTLKNILQTLFFLPTLAKEIYIN